MILASTVFDWSTRVTDGRTDRQTDRRTDGRAIAYSALSMLSRAKNHHRPTLRVATVIISLSAKRITTYWRHSMIRKANFDSKCSYNFYDCSKGKHYALVSVFCLSIYGGVVTMGVLGPIACTLFLKWRPWHFLVLPFYFRRNRRLNFFDVAFTDIF